MLTAAAPTRPIDSWRAWSPAHGANASSSAFAGCLAGRWTGPALLALVCFLAFFLGLGDSHLFDPDEGRSAEVAREMLVSHHWLVPTLGFEQFHDKPAFYYWLIAGSIELLGANDWAVRAPGAVAATLTVIATSVWGARYLGKTTGLLAGVVLATTLGFIGMGRIVLTDATFAWWVVAALLYAGAWWIEGAKARWPVWPFYLALALATLTKGPVAPVLALLVLVPFAWWTGRPASLRALRPLQGALILLAVAGTWYAAASVAAPAYVWNFLWNHNVRRYAEGHGGHSAGVFTFLYLLPAVYLPWSLYFPTSLAALVRAARRGRLPRPLLFCALWAGAVVGFFSLGGSKLPTYVLPAFPPLALLVANALADVVAHDRDPAIPARVHQTVLGVLAAASAVAGVALFVFLDDLVPARLALAALPIAAAVPLAIASRHVAGGRHSAAVAGVALCALANAAGYYFLVAPALDEVYSYARPAELLRAAHDDVAVFTYKTSAYSLEYYAGRRTREARTAADAGRLLSGPAPVVLVTRDRHLDAIRRSTTEPLTVWWEGPRSRVVVANRPPPELATTTSERPPAAAKGA